MKDELAELHRTAEGHRKDAATWHERYEKAKTSITTENLGDLQRRAAVEKVMKIMKEDLVPVSRSVRIRKHGARILTYIDHSKAPLSWMSRLRPPRKYVNPPLSLFIDLTV